MNTPHPRIFACGLISLLMLVTLVPAGFSQSRKQSGGLLEYDLSLNSYLDDYLTHVKENKQKSEDWFMRMPSEKQDLVIKALKKLGDWEILAEFESERPAGTKSHIIKKILDPVIPNRPANFMVIFSDKNGKEVSLEGELHVKDAGSTILHNFEKFGTDDMATMRHKLILTIKGGGLDLKDVTIANHKTYTAAYVNE